jgi:HEAT repeat protein
MTVTTCRLAAEHLGHRSSLTKLGTPAAIPALLEALGDPDAISREWALAGLATVAGDDAETIRVIAKHISDPRLRVRLAAVSALEMAASPPAVEPLNDALARLGRWERIRARRALRSITKC